ncbi:MAG: putative large secreted protein, partial [Frankiales bacterium]|nr:putative large secreted protein [Frankiales bacterium]
MAATRLSKKTGSLAAGASIAVLLALTPAWAVPVAAASPVGAHGITPAPPAPERSRAQGDSTVPPSPATVPVLTSAPAVILPTASSVQLDLPTDGSSVKATAQMLRLARAPQSSSQPSRVAVKVLTAKEIAKIGGIGSAFTVGRADGKSDPSAAQIVVDYSSWRHLSGGNFASRLHLVSLPACSLDPEPAPECLVPTDLGAANDLNAGTLTATVPLGSTAATVQPSDATTSAVTASPNVAATATAASTAQASPEADASVSPVASATASASGTATSSSPNPSVTTSPSAPDQSAGGAPDTVIAVQAAQQSQAGQLGVPPVAGSDHWAVGEQSGDFNYSIPIKAPPSVATDAPNVTLQYSSQSVDGRTQARNNQASMQGMGWEYNPGYIARATTSCREQTSLTAMQAFNDLCWVDPPAAGAKESSLTLTLNGQSGRLYKDQSGQYKLENDPGWRIEYVGTGDMYWVVTTDDGTKYFFGRTINAPNGTKQTLSTLHVPTFATQSNECGYVASGGYCNLPYQWNLDNIIDPTGKAT